MKSEKTLGLAIRELREKSGMTQLQLANELGYDSMQFVSLFERSLSKVPMKVLGKIILIFKLKEKDAAPLIEKILTAQEDEVYAGIEEGQKEFFKKKNQFNNQHYVGIKRRR